MCIQRYMSPAQPKTFSIWPFTESLSTLTIVVKDKKSMYKIFRDLALSTSPLLHPLSSLFFLFCSYRAAPGARDMPGVLTPLCSPVLGHQSRTCANASLTPLSQPRAPHAPGHLFTQSSASRTRPPCSPLLTPICNWELRESRPPFSPLRPAPALACCPRAVSPCCASGVPLALTVSSSLPHQSTSSALKGEV